MRDEEEEEDENELSEVLDSTAGPFADSLVTTPPGAGGSLCTRPVADDDEPLGDLTEPEFDPANPPPDPDGGDGGGVTPPPDDPPELVLPPLDDPDDDELPEPELELPLDVRGTACAFTTTGTASVSATATEAARRTIGLTMALSSRGPES